jgi:polyisoprenoid-binding protein YceI
MKKILTPIIIILILTITSCGEDKTSKVVSDNVNQTCFYSYDANAETLVRWTAFKTSDKVAVAGQFNQVNVDVGDKSTKITDVLETIKFNIPTSSTNTTDPERDSKIISSFFGAMNATDIIFGHVKSVAGDNKSGTCTFYLTINNIEKETTLNYTVNDASIKLTGEIDLTDWEGENAIASLNEVCKLLHTGADGVSKTWPNVELTIETTLKKICH